MFMEAFASSTANITAVNITVVMQLYVTSSPVKLYHVRNEAEDGRLIPLAHVPQHGDINAMARVIVLMSEPTVQCHTTFPLLLYAHTCYRRKRCGTQVPMRIGQGLPLTIQHLQELQ